MPSATSLAAVSGIPGFVALAVLGAAVLHAAWNALAKSVDDQLVGFVILDVAAGVLALALAVVVGGPAPAAWPYIAGSLALHCAYQGFLLNGYRVGDLNQVYPIARGTAPLAVAVLAVLTVGEHLEPPGLVGLVAVAGGLVGLVGRQRRDGQTDHDHAHHRGAVVFAFATGLVIAAYTVVDGIGVRRAGNPAGYAAWLLAADALPVPLYALALRRDRLRAQWRRTWPRASLGGALSLTAYGIVLWAQTRGALAAVAALRETSVVAAALIGAFVFDEALGRRRIAAAAAVTAGVVLLKTS
jgi:drug/metabolite transporter (DMT)-like permease